MQIGYVRYIAKLFSRDNWPKINSLFIVGLRNVFVLSALDFDNYISCK